MAEALAAGELERHAFESATAIPVRLNCLLFSRFDCVTMLISNWPRNRGSKGCAVLTVRFFNVGHGECTLIEHHSGRLTMVDINTSHDYDWNTRQEILAGVGGTVGAASRSLAEAAALDEAQRELTDPVDYLERHYAGRQLFRFILTHPDLDHMRGLKRLREKVGFANFWDVRHTKAQPTFRGDNDREEWDHYQQLRSGKFGLTPRFYDRGDEKFAFARDENQLGNGDNIEILSPTPALVDACNRAETSNNLSYVLRFRHANRTVLLTGDVEEDAWTDLETVYINSLKSDFLQASHHGRDSGFHASSLKLIAPRVVVVSVGRKPSTDAHAKYKAICNNVWSTRYYGDITLQIADDGTYKWIVERNADS
jgi:competence protein ComEC